MSESRIAPSRCNRKRVFTMKGRKIGLRETSLSDSFVRPSSVKVTFGPDKPCIQSVISFLGKLLFFASLLFASLFLCGGFSGGFSVEKAESFDSFLLGKCDFSVGKVRGALIRTCSHVGWESGTVLRTVLASTVQDVGDRRDCHRRDWHVTGRLVM